MLIFEIIGRPEEQTASEFLYYSVTTRCKRDFVTVIKGALALRDAVSSSEQNEPDCSVF